MSSWFGRWFAYGVGSAVGNAIFREEARKREEGAVHSMTEEEIQADERRYDEEARKLEAEHEEERRRARHPNVERAATTFRPSR